MVKQNLFNPRKIIFGVRFIRLYFYTLFRFYKYLQKTFKRWVGFNPSRFPAAMTIFSLLTKLLLQVPKIMCVRSTKTRLCPSMIFRIQPILNIPCRHRKNTIKHIGILIKNAINSWTTLTITQRYSILLPRNHNSTRFSIVISKEMF